METVRAAVLPSSLWAGPFLYGTGSLAVQEEAQCPNRGGVTCSQDSILSGPRGPVRKPCPWLTGRKRHTPECGSCFSGLGGAMGWPEPLFAFFIIWLSPPSTHTPRNKLWKGKLLWVTIWWKNQRFRKTSLWTLCALARFHPPVLPSLICICAHGVCGQMKKLGREGLRVSLSKLYFMSHSNGLSISKSLTIRNNVFLSSAPQLVTLLQVPILWQRYHTFAPIHPSIISQKSFKEDQA